MSAAPADRVAILIAAMGGEGGGVLTDWIVAAATGAGFVVQSTSIPGVAQRTGATTYYVEIVPPDAARRRNARPVLALNPALGEVDVMMATELMEAARAAANGWMSPDRTTLIASTHRVFAMSERLAMGDGRFDTGQLLRAVKEFSHDRVLFDMEQAAEESGGVLNAVLLGALAGTGRTPVPVEAFEAAVKAGGKAVAANLAGFRFGLAHARGDLEELAREAARRAAADAGAGAPLARARALLARAPFDAALAIVEEGVRRLVQYQG
ncbi:MAG: 2-oxoacid:acceptor oxidoreductase family protein, partial [Rhodospirillales bacterium]|nr:2-oxoacid:acceptor oxidoreductase family protein [Rhodospirillales bacterium]